MAERTNIFLRRTFVAVTGTSRGVGKAIAKEFATNLPFTSVMVLLARNVEVLQQVKSELNISSPGIIVLVQQYDQGKVDHVDYFNNIFDDLLKENNLSKDVFEQYMIVHNCASPGDVSKTALQMTDSVAVRDYCDINITGMILLNTSFFKTFSDSTKSRVIVNMTSRASKNPTASFSLNCTGKAARHMFFRVLAVEEPSIRVLTCNPGPCDTDMFLYAQENTCSHLLSTVCKGIREDGRLFSTKESACGLVNHLEKNNFENAAYVDAVKFNAAPHTEKLLKTLEK